jgi:hypothetical protein
MASTLSRPVKPLIKDQAGARILAAVCAAVWISFSLRIQTWV